MSDSHLRYINTRAPLDRQYLNVSIRYEDNSTGETFAEFQEDRDVPILNKPDDWFMSITRFTITGRPIPIFVMDVQPDIGDPTNANYTVYSVTLIYYTLAGPNLVPNYYQIQVIYSPNNTLSQPDPPVAGDPKNMSKYYYVHAYQHMLDMVNTAMASALTALRTVHGAAIQTESPYFIYNDETSLISLVTQFDYTEQITGNLGGSVVTINKLAVCVNDKLHDKCFNGLPSVHRGNQLVNGDDYQFDVFAYVGNQNAYATPGATIPAYPANDPLYLIFSQEGNTLDHWNDFRDIVFTTRSIPIYKEMVKSSDSPDGKPNVLAIITDFQPNLSGALTGSSILSYFQEGPYRIINLLSPNPMRTFGFVIWWQDKRGNRTRLTLGYNEEINVRFMFARKNTFTS